MLVKNFDEVKTYIVYLYLEEDDVEVAKVDTKFLTDVTDNELNFGAPCKVHWARKPGNSPYKIPLGNRYLIPLVDGGNLNYTDYLQTFFLLRRLCYVEDPSDLNKIALAINKKEIRPVNIIPDFNIDTARKEICDLKSRALSPKTSDEADNLTCDVGENRKSARKRLLKVDDEKPKAKKQIFVEVAARKKNWDRLVSSIKVCIVD